MQINGKIDDQYALPDAARSPHTDQEPGFARKGREMRGEGAQAAMVIRHGVPETKLDCSCGPRNALIMPPRTVPLESEHTHDRRWSAVVSVFGGTGDPLSVKRPRSSLRLGLGMEKLAPPTLSTFGKGTVIIEPLGRYAGYEPAREGL